MFRWRVFVAACVCFWGLGVSAQRVTPMEGPVFPSVEVVPLRCLARCSCPAGELRTLVGLVDAYFGSGAAMVGLAVGTLRRVVLL